MRAAGRVLTRDVLIESVWGVDRDIEGNTLEVFIGLLRKKVDEPFATKLVQTVHAVGYCLRAGE